MDLFITGRTLLLPKFTRFGLQNTANNGRLWLQVASLLLFIDSNLGLPYRAKTTIPTLFIWQPPETNRTYVSFEYLAIEMKSTRYTPHDLLVLRENSQKVDVAERLWTKLQGDPDIGSFELSRFCLRN